MSKTSEKRPGVDVVRTTPIAGLECPDWCTDCGGWDGECMEHCSIVNLTPGKKTEVAVHLAQTIDSDSAAVLTRSAWAYIDGGDAWLDGDDLRAAAKSLMEAAELMDLINAEVAA